MLCNKSTEEMKEKIAEILRQLIIASASKSLDKIRDQVLTMNADTPNDVINKTREFINQEKFLGGIYKEEDGQKIHMRVSVDGSALVAGESTEAIGPEIEAVNVLMKQLGEIEASLQSE